MNLLFIPIFIFFATLILIGGMLVLDQWIQLYISSQQNMPKWAIYYQNFYHNYTKPYIKIILITAAVYFILGNIVNKFFPQHMLLLGSIVSTMSLIYTGYIFATIKND